MRRHVRKSPISYDSSSSIPEGEGIANESLTDFFRASVRTTDMLVVYYQDLQPNDILDELIAREVIKIDDRERIISETTR